MIIWNRILAAMDETEASLDAMRYLASVLGGSDACQVHLLGVFNPLPADARTEARNLTQEEAEQLEAMELCMAQAQDMLIEAGIPEENVSLQVVKSGGRTISETILAVQAQGGYGTVVLGRHHLSKAEEFLFGSVSSDVMHAAKNFSVWVVA